MNSDISQRKYHFLGEQRVLGRMVQTLSKELKRRWVLYRLNLHKLIHLYSTLELILRSTTLCRTYTGKKTKIIQLLSLFCRNDSVLKMVEGTRR